MSDSTMIPRITLYGGRADKPGIPGTEPRVRHTKTTEVYRFPDSSFDIASRLSSIERNATCAGAYYAGVYCPLAWRRRDPHASGAVIVARCVMPQISANLGAHI